MTWFIVSWVLVLLLTGINVVAFLKLKQAGDQISKMMFPGSKNMGDAMANMQRMMGGMQGGMPQKGGRGPMGGRGGNPDMQAQLKAAMDMLQNMKKK